MPGPCLGSFGAIQPGAVPAVASFQAADPAFAAGPPFDGAAERWTVLGGLAGLARFTFAGDHDGPHAQVVQVILDTFLAVTAVGGDGPGTAPGAADDPLDGGRELRGIGRIARTVISTGPRKVATTSCNRRP